MEQVTMQDLEDIDVWKKYFKKCYKYFNGRINPYHKARKLILEDREIIDLGDNKIHTNATMNVDVIRVNIPEIYNAFKAVFYNHIDITLDWRGWCIATIAHELSHVDQYTAWYMMTTLMPEDIRNAYEYANEMNTRKFIERYRDEIRHELGDFDTSIVNELNTYTMQMEKNGNNGVVVPYRKIYSDIQHMWSILSSILLLDVYKLVTDKNIKRVTLVFNDQFKNLNLDPDIASVMYFNPYELDDPETSYSINSSKDVIGFISNNLYGEYGDSRHWEIQIGQKKENLEELIILFRAAAVKAGSSTMSVGFYDAEDQDTKLYTAQDAVNDYLKKIGYTK